MAFRVGRCCALSRRPWAMRETETAPSMYSHTGRVNSGWLLSELTTLGSRVMSANVRSNKAASIPAAMASLRSNMRHSSKLSNGVGLLASLAAGLAGVVLAVTGAAASGCAGAGSQKQQEAGDGAMGQAPKKQ